MMDKSSLHETIRSPVASMSSALRRGMRQLPQLRIAGQRAHARDAQEETHHTVLE